MEVEIQLSDSERLRLEAFLEDHDDCVDCGLRITQSRGSGIGVSTTVSCPCGKERDLTDYSRW